jgi:hypothetical protein
LFPPFSQPVTRPGGFAQELRQQQFRRLKPLQQEREAGLRRLPNEEESPLADLA